MMGHERESLPAEPTLDHEVLKGVYEAEHRPTHDRKWEELAADNPELARKALVRAQEIRALGDIDPGDAYLQGLADDHATHERQDMVDDVRRTLDNI